jgi:lipopolysaccharide/colanic/teichoic acid biosynthesis glycosyltransferase
MLAIRLTSAGPAIFRQQRVGRNGSFFTLYKLRTMRASNQSIQVTAATDARMTAIGRLLRKTKIDELPELWNIVRGDMSLVGPRPEVPRYVDLKNVRWRQVLQVRPGLTDPITLQLRNEEELLAAVTGNREEFYLTALQPYKLNGYLEYLKHRTWKSDVSVLLCTVVAVARPSRRPAPSVEDIRSLS